MAFKMKAGEEGPMKKNFPNMIGPAGALAGAIGGANDGVELDAASGGAVAGAASGLKKK
jgi:hypothetical protein